MTPTPTLYHALLRPCVLQTLRATGYHATRPTTLDAYTDLAARYLYALCRATALHAIDNHNEGKSPDDLADPDEGDPRDDGPAIPPISIVDVRLALEEVGALGIVERFIEPDEPHGQTTAPAQQQQNGTSTEGAANGDDASAHAPSRRHPDDDTRGVDEFAAWFAGAKCRAIRDMVVAGFGDGVVPAGSTINEGEVVSADYLHGEYLASLPPSLWRYTPANAPAALMSKHSKSAEESKFHGTILGKGTDIPADVSVEGGDLASVSEWSRSLLGPGPQSRAQSPTPNPGDSRPPSSGLSSVGDRLGDDRDSMELS